MPYLKAHDLTFDTPLEITLKNIAKIPPDVQYITISKISEDYSGTQLAQAFQLFQGSSEMVIDLSFNKLYKLGGEGLATSLQGFQKTAVTAVSIGNNNLHEINGEELAIGLKGLQNTQVKAIDLTGNELGEKFRTTMSIAHLPGINPLMIGLSRKDEEYSKQSGKKLAMALQSLKGTRVERVNLSHNQFGFCKNPELIKEVLESFQGTAVRMVNLSHNGLGLIRSADLATGFAAFSDTSVVSLDLTQNHFEKISSQEFTLILNALPQAVQSIIFSLEDLQQMNKEQLQAIHKRFPKASNVIILSKGQAIDITQRAGEMIYQSLGFSISLANLSLFAVAKHREINLMKCKENLPEELSSQVETLRRRMP